MRHPYLRALTLKVDKGLRCYMLSLLSERGGAGCERRVVQQQENTVAAADVRVVLYEFRYTISGCDGSSLGACE
jgi:hypothetical protein